MCCAIGIIAGGDGHLPAIERAALRGGSARRSETRGGMNTATVAPTSLRGFGSAAEFQVEDQYSLRRNIVSSAADLRRTVCEFDTELGSCRYTVLAGSDYQASWGTYVYRPGLTWSVITNEPSVALCFQLRGRAQRNINPAGADLDLGSGEMAVAVAPATTTGLTLERELDGSTCDVILSRGYFLRLAERHPELLESAAERLLANRGATLTAPHLPITARVWALLRRIRDAGGKGPAADGPAFDGPAGALLFEAAIIELLALQLSGAPAYRDGGDVKLSRADVERVHAARDLLLERLADPPTLAELARHALTNEFKLKRGFRMIFGSSPYAYFLEHRLELARSYLLDTDWTIATIAHRIGYRDPAHLTHAFRKRYGVPPSHVRGSR